MTAVKVAQRERLRVEREASKARQRRVLFAQADYQKFAFCDGCGERRYCARSSRGRRWLCVDCIGPRSLRPAAAAAATVVVLVALAFPPAAGAHRLPHKPFSGMSLAGKERWLGGQVAHDRGVIRALTRNGNRWRLNHARYPAAAAVARPALRWHRVSLRIASRNLARVRAARRAASVAYWIRRQIAAAEVIGREADAAGGDPWPNCPDPYDHRGHSWWDTVGCENEGSWLDSPGFFRCGLQFHPSWELRFGRLCP